MLLFMLIAGAAITWYIGKTFDSPKDVKNMKGETIIRAKNGTYPNLGTERQLAKNFTDITKATRIGDWSSKNPRPLIDIQGGGENVRVTDFKKQPILPQQKLKFARLVHQRENLEEYFRFDQYLGGIYPDQRPTERRSTIAYKYN